MSAPLKTYRVYCLDAAQHMVTADWIEAAGDAEAIARAEADGFGSKCEIWEGQRLVAKLDGERREA
jgi:hypothetical protein